MPQIMNQTSQHRTQTSTLESEYQASLVLQEQASLADDSLPFYDSFQYYGDRLLPHLPSQSLNLLVESDNATLDVNFALDVDESLVQSEGNVLSSKPLPLDPAFDNSVFTTCGCLQSIIATLSTLH